MTTAMKQVINEDTFKEMKVVIEKMFEVFSNENELATSNLHVQMMTVLTRLPEERFTKLIVEQVNAIKDMSKIALFFQDKIYSSEEEKRKAASSSFLGEILKKLPPIDSILGQMRSTGLPNNPAFTDALFAKLIEFKELSVEDMIMIVNQNPPNSTKKKIIAYLGDKDPMFYDPGMYASLLQKTKFEENDEKLRAVLASKLLSEYLYYPLILSKGDKESRQKAAAGLADKSDNPDILLEIIKWGDSEAAEKAVNSLINYCGQNDYYLPLKNAISVLYEKEDPDKTLLNKATMVIYNAEWEELETEERLALLKFVDSEKRTEEAKTLYSICQRIYDSECKEFQFLSHLVDANLDDQKFVEKLCKKMMTLPDCESIHMMRGNAFDNYSTECPIFNNAFLAIANHSKDEEKIIWAITKLTEMTTVRSESLEKVLYLQKKIISPELAEKLQKRIDTQKSYLAWAESAMKLVKFIATVAKKEIGYPVLNPSSPFSMGIPRGIGIPDNVGVRVIGHEELNSIFDKDNKDPFGFKMDF